MALHLHRQKRLLLVFIHGFRGDDFTFQDFPERLRTVLTNSLRDCDVEAVTFPRYETRGDLKSATDRFCNWLLNTLDESRRTDPLTGEILVLLVGHSMGGLLAADAILQLEGQSAPDTPQGDLKASSEFSPHASPTTATASAPQGSSLAAVQPSPLRAHQAVMLGLLAFDSPFYGINSSLWTDAAIERASAVSDQVSTYLPAITAGTAAVSSFFGSKAASGSAPAAAVTTRSATTIANAASASSKWGIGKWGAVAAGALVASAAAAAATYSQRTRIQDGIGYITGHLEFVSDLVRHEQLVRRVQRLVALPRVFFHCYYNELEKSAIPARTFIALPPPTTRSHFEAVPAEAPDEIEAHIAMFKPSANSHYYTLGDMAIHRIIDMVKAYGQDPLSPKPVE
ncbi:hypothetical protein IWQ60_012135 [Tieghemiomyces parasiticus]|uniref:DUF676 domain-containing protein n=1 Tax=Tieghemiomyces parasiticus TaxID=78921 RepID=A0A9W7ZLL9_9FUNG|nr:hypothetical protein IWQ60_012135 [Tieghemiomyces parasiticus]